MFSHHIHSNRSHHETAGGGGRLVFPEHILIMITFVTGNEQLTYFFDIDQTTLLFSDIGIVYK